MAIKKRWKNFEKHHGRAAVVKRCRSTSQLFYYKLKVGKNGEIVVAIFELYLEEPDASGSFFVEKDKNKYGIYKMVIVK